MDKSHTNPHALFIPLTERLKTIPEIFGIRVNEEPEYKVIRHEGRFEIREYGTQTLARVTLEESDFDVFANKAFLKLAHYIFSGNSRQENIPMTSPVLLQHGAPQIENPDPAVVVQTNDEDKETSGGLKKTMWFILPKKMDLFTAPSPLNSEIHLEERGARTVASVSYSGNNTSHKIKSYKQSLAKWVADQPDYRDVGMYYTAQYDAPFTLPFIKRNEVQVEVIWSH